MVETAIAWTSQRRSSLSQCPEDMSHPISAPSSTCHRALRLDDHLARRDHLPLGGSSFGLFVGLRAMFLRAFIAAVVAAFGPPTPNRGNSQGKPNGYNAKVSGHSCVHWRFSRNGVVPYVNLQVIRTAPVRKRPPLVVVIPCVSAPSWSRFGSVNVFGNPQLQAWRSTTLDA